MACETCSAFVTSPTTASIFSFNSSGTLFISLTKALTHFPVIKALLLKDSDKLDQYYLLCIAHKSYVI